MSDKLGLKRNPLASPVMAVVLLGWPVALTAVAPAQQGVYESRKALEASAAGSQDPEVLTRLAAAQEVYADRAPATYLRLADQFMLGSPERAHALERGFALALRDGNLTQARSFALFLDGSGHPQAYALLGERVAPDNNAVVPGGLAGLAYVAQLPRGTGYHRLLAEFARQVASTVCWKCQGDRLTPKVLAYFAAITSLEAEGERNLNEVSITLSLNGNAERERTDSALHDLGLRLRNDKGQIRLEREKESVTKKPDMAAALAVDVAGVQAALQAGKPYVLKIQDEPAAVYPSAKLWKDSFPKADQRQFALTLLGDPVQARLYLAMSTLDRQTIPALIGNSGLFFFEGQPADMISLYGSAFAIQGQRAWVPGGVAAAPVWAQMAGVSPEQGGDFYRALVQQQNPTLLTYFYALAHLDLKHQSFYTANLSRAKRFYALFSTLPEAKAYAGDTATTTTFNEMLESVPLDDHGHVAFPGSPQIWTGGKVATPEVEDEALLRMFESRYKAGSVAASELGSFLAVAHIDAHRAKPLDEESAQTLGRHYSVFSPAYPYFTNLTAVDAAGFRSFFSVAETLNRLPLLEQNLAMGQLYSLMEWVVLIRRRDAIDDAEAVRLFGHICDELGAANGEGARSLAAADLVQGIVAACGLKRNGGPDDSLRGCLLAGAADGVDHRGEDFEAVLDRLKAPRLETVVRIAAVAEEAMNPAPDSAPIPTISLDQDALRSVPASFRMNGREKDNLLQYDPARVLKLVAEWNENAAKSPQDRKTAQRLAGELLKAIAPQITLAVAAPVYAYFLRSTDLVLSDEPLLLRKHQYIDFAAAAEHRFEFGSMYALSREGLGVYLEGSFAQFAVTSGLAATSSWKQGGEGELAGMAEQLAGIRSATWERLRESDQRLVALRILAAREWIVAAAEDAGNFSSLGDETFRLLSLARRADLLHGIEERDWPRVWASMTLPDLYRLGGRYLDRHPSGSAESPAIAQLRAAAAADDSTHDDGMREDILGGNIPNHVLGCDHTHLVTDGPYEQYQSVMQAAGRAERSAEFKIFLAWRADSLGVQPSELPVAAEKLAAKAFSVSHITDYHDWRSLLSAYASITEDDLKSALEHGR